MAVSVGVVEDEAFARTALVTALRAHGVHVVFDTGQAPLALELCRIRRPQVAVIDIHLGGGPSGVDLAIQLRRDLPGVGIVFLTSFDEPRLLGASLPPLPPGSVYLAKSSVSTMADVLRAIEAAAHWKVASTSGSPSSAPHRGEGNLAELTDEQIETLRLVAAGLSNAEIARRRLVREKSVEVMIGRIAKKLGLGPDAARNQRVHLARVYLRTLGAKDSYE